MKLYIGGINHQTTETALTNLLKPFGDVENIHVAIDKDTNTSKGFAFALMPNDEQAQTAITGLDQTTFEERTITVRKANPKKSSGTQAAEVPVAEIPAAETNHTA